MDYTWHYSSPLGTITLASDGEALVGLWFDGQKHFAATLDPCHPQRPLPVFAEAEKWLNLYFSGKAPGFTPLLRPRGTAFQLAVWQMLLTVPFGQTVTYGQLARQLAAVRGPIRVSPRAVGGAVGRNGLSLIIPCHRVIGTQGQLTGYAGGLERKRWLLAMEQGAAGLPANVPE